MEELIEDVLEDLVFGSGQIDLAVLLLDSKDSGFELDLLDKGLQ